MQLPAAYSAKVIVDIPDHALMSLLANTADQNTFDHLFEELFYRYNRQVTRWCYKLARNQDRALDLAQEVFVKAFRSIHTFRGDSHLSTWLYVITRNHCLNRLRQFQREPDGQAADGSCCQLVSRAEDAQSVIERTQAYQHTFDFLRSLLTPLEIQVIVLHHVHEMTLSAITRKLRLSNRSGAKAYIVSAKRKLKPLCDDASEFRRQLNAWRSERSSRSKAA